MLFSVISLNGRMKRRSWWTANVVLFVIVCVAVPIISAIPFPPSEGLGASRLPTLVFVLFWLAYYPAFAINVKRAHDRNKSAWYVAVISIPLDLYFLGETAADAGPHNFGLVHLPGIWLFAWGIWTVELGMLPGTDGPNRFGDPDSADLREVRTAVEGSAKRLAPSEPGKRLFGRVR
jgi:uncharacterized membrane protein YhaH (DUF805 family)